MSPYSSSSSAAVSSSPASSEHQSALARELPPARTGLAVGNRNVAAPATQAVVSPAPRPGTAFWTACPTSQEEGPLQPRHQPCPPRYEGHHQARFGWAGAAAPPGKPSGGVGGQLMVSYPAASTEHLHCPSKAPGAPAAALQPYLLAPERSCRASCQTSSDTH